MRRHALTIIALFAFALTGCDDSLYLGAPDVRPGVDDPELLDFDVDQADETDGGDETGGDGWGGTTPPDVGGESPDMGWCCICPQAPDPAFPDNCAYMEIGECPGEWDPAFPWICE